MLHSDWHFEVEMELARVSRPWDVSRSVLAFIWHIYCLFCEFICNIWLSCSHLSHYCAYRQNHATPLSKWVWMRLLKATDGSWSAQCNMTPPSQSNFLNTWTHTRHCIAFQSGASEQMPAQLELWLLLWWAQYLTLWMMSLLTLFDCTLFTNYMLQMGDFRHLQL